MMQTQAEQKAKATGKQIAPRAALASNAVLLVAGVIAAGLAGEAAAAAAFVAGAILGLTAAYAIMIRM